MPTCLKSRLDPYFGNVDNGRVSLDHYAVLKIRDFRLALTARFFDSMARQMLDVAVGWQVYQLTHDPLLLGFIGLSEALAYMSVALWVGHLVDRTEKRRILINSEVGIFVSAASLMLLALMRQSHVLPIYALVAFGGFCRCFQWTTMAAYIQLSVPREIFPKAAAWNVSVWQIATIAGPALGGLIYAIYGASLVYATAAACFLAASAAIVRMAKMAPAGAQARQSGVADFMSGVRFVFSERIMLAAMSLDMFGVLFGGVEGVLPIFAGLMGVGPTGLGLLIAAPAAGALLCSILLAHHNPFRRTGTTFVSCVAVFGVCMIAFAFSRNFLLSLLILSLGGGVDGVGMVLRSSIYQALTPDHFKGRVSSVNGIFIRSSNELGAFESGLAAKLMGLVPSVIFGGCMTMVSVAVAIWTAPDLGKFRLGEKPAA